MSQVTRRQMLSGMSAAALSSGMLQAQAQRPPNVIFIFADDLGYGDIGCYGQKLIPTPHIDKLAAEGLLFRQAYSGSTVCAPSRCCLMTGKHTGHATVRGNKDPHVPLRADELTLAEAFKKAGYATGAFGKWGLGTPSDYHALPTRKGFDTFYGYLHQVHAHSYFPHMLWDNEREQYFEPNFHGKKVYSHDKIAQRALAFIDDNRAKPFFLFAPFTLPHGRFEVPDAKPYDDRDWPPEQKALASMISRLDATVGAILDRLRQHNLEDNTLVLFSSDNGPVAMGLERFNRAGQYRGIKRDLYEGGIRVPLLARWKGTIQPGETNLATASWDFLPTVTELLKQPMPTGLDGVSILPTLLGRPQEQKPHEYLYWEFFERGFQQALRMGDWKGIRLAPKTPLELYNIAQDPTEKLNVATENPAIVKQLEAKLLTCRTPSEHWG